LLANLFIALDCAAIWLPRPGKNHPGELGGRADIMPLQLADLAFRDTCNKREVIVRAAFSVAVLSPPAYVAMRVGTWIEIPTRAVIDRPLKTAPNVTVIGRIVRRPIGFRLEASLRRHNITELGQLLLCRREQLGIQCKLQNGATLRFLGKLRIDGL